MIFCYSYVKLLRNVSHSFTIVIKNNLCINILKHFHHILTTLSPYLVKVYLIRYI